MIYCRGIIQKYFILLLEMITATINRLLDPWKAILGIHERLLYASVLQELEDQFLLNQRVLSEFYSNTDLYLPERMLRFSVIKSRLLKRIRIYIHEHQSNPRISNDFRLGSRSSCDKLSLFQFRYNASSHWQWWIAFDFQILKRE